MIRKARNFQESLGFALDGIIYSFRTQRNMRIDSCFVLGIIFASVFLGVSSMEILVLILISVVVMALEMVNTAVETVVDMYTEEYLPLAKTAKNVAAGAVLLASLGAVIIGLIIFIPKVWQLLK